MLQTFFLLTGKSLFNTKLPDFYTNFLKDGVEWAETDDQVIENLIWQIAVFTNQKYHPIVLSVYPASPQYFIQNTGSTSSLHINWRDELTTIVGSLRSFKEYASRPLELIIQDAGFEGPEDDRVASCALIRRCLKLNPTDRPSAKDLLEDPWLQNQ